MDLLHVDVACCCLLLGPLAIEVVCRDGGPVQHLDGADQHVDKDGAKPERRGCVCYAIRHPRHGDLVHLPDRLV